MSNLRGNSAAWHWSIGARSSPAGSECCWATCRGTSPSGRHLADQLMLPLGIGAYLGSGGGVFRTMELSPHATTHLEILRRFLETEVRVKQCGPEDWLVRIG